MAMSEQDRGRLSTAMRELRSGMSMEHLYAVASDLYRQGVLQVVEDRSGATEVKEFYVGDVHQGNVLDMKALRDYHTGRGFTPPWGNLHVYNPDGTIKESVEIPQAKSKIWG